MRSIAELDARYYPAYVDEHARFRQAVDRYVKSEDAILDAGAGRGQQYPYDLKDRVRLVVGADVDDAVRANPNLHAATVADLARLPYADASFDLVFSKYVFEHLAEPVAVLRELRRVMKPGGHLVFHTPNRFHYVSLAAQLSPHRFHVWFNAKRGREEEDTFETVYRANDRFALRRICERSGFRLVELELFEPKPTYLFFHPAAYAAGIAYERVVSRFDALRDARCVMIGVLRAI